MARHNYINSINILTGFVTGIIVRSRRVFHNITRTARLPLRGRVVRRERGGLRRRMAVGARDDLGRLSGGLAERSVFRITALRCFYQMIEYHQICN